MNAQNHSVKVVSKSTLAIQADTGAHEKRLEEIGFSKEFQRSSEKRSVILDLKTDRPSTKEEAGPGNWREVEIEGPVVSFSSLTTLDGELRMIFITTDTHIFTTVVSGKRVWTYVTNGFAPTLRDVVRVLFNDGLLHGQKAFERNNELLPNFWQKIFALVYKEPTKIEIGVRNRDQQYIPSRLYFHPEDPKQNILSVGGWCYGIYLDEFPRDALNKGVAQWGAEERKRGASSGTVSLGALLVKPGNKQKKATRTPKRADFASLGIKTLSEQLVVHEVPEHEKALLAKREAAKKQAAAAAKPASNQGKEKQKKKASA